MQIDWAGVAFLPLDHHDGRFIHAAGLWAFARRDAGDGRTLLFVDHAHDIAGVARSDHPLFAEALSLGMNELHVCLHARERTDRLQLCAHVVRRVGPILNVLAQAYPPGIIDPRRDPLDADPGDALDLARQRMRR